MEFRDPEQGFAGAGSKNRHVLVGVVQSVKSGVTCGESAGEYISFGLGDRVAAPGQRGTGMAAPPFGHRVVREVRILLLPGIAQEGLNEGVVVPVPQFAHRCRQFVASRLPVPGPPGEVTLRRLRCAVRQSPVAEFLPQGLGEGSRGCHARHPQLQYVHRPGAAGEAAGTLFLAQGVRLRPGPAHLARVLSQPP